MKNVNEIENDLNNIIERVDQIKRDLELITKPEFKVGQWIYFKNPVSGCLGVGPKGIGRVVETPQKIHSGLTTDDSGIYIAVGSDNYVWKINAEILRLATPAEIESHLRKICDEKYIGKKVRCLHADYFEDQPSLQIQIPHHFSSYSAAKDLLAYSDSAGHGVYVYEQGKFAEVIADKKKLPKTRAEYRKFLDDFWHALPEDDDMPGLISDDFLNEYEL